jgi:hypothetical protein
MMRSLVSAASVLAVLAGQAFAEDKLPLELKLMAKKDTYAWPFDQPPKEFEASLRDALKKKLAELPQPMPVDLVLRITNTGTEKVTVFVDGDPNVHTFSLKGPGVLAASPLLAFTADLRLPKPLELEPGKSHEVPITVLADGFRKISRNIYPLAPGEYTLSATYQLSTIDGEKGPVLKSGEVTIKIEEPKK